ncbi:MAG: FG-GAP-like repeat-containing protein [Ignavibacteriaceae bacterium]
MLNSVKYIALIILIFLLVFNNVLTSKIVDKGKHIKNNKYFVSIISSPVKHHISQIQMLSSNRGFATGSYFLEYNGKDWNLSQHTEVLNNIFCFYAETRNNILLAKIMNPLSESELYSYNGKDIKKLPHPFGNTITSSFVTPKGKIWIGGDREIAFYDGKWHNLPFPRSLTRVGQIFANDNNEAWINTLDGKLFYYSNNKWTQYLSEEYIKSIDFKNINNGIILAGNKILNLSNFSASLIESDPILSKALSIYSTSTGSIWLIGTEGLIVHYKDKTLEIIPSGVKVKLNSLSVVADNEIWIGGDYGTILKIADKETPDKGKKGLSFISILPVPYARNLDDQYGVAIEDLDNDGFKDIYIVCIFNPNSLYMNNLKDSSDARKEKEFSFSEESVIRNVSGVVPKEKSDSYTKLQLGAGVADIDNDGDQDIYICSLIDKNKLLLNDGNGYFRDVSKQSDRGIGDIKDRTNAVAFSDIDNDGDLDLFITNEYSTNRLYENNGNGFFHEITKEAGLSSIGGSMGASFADVNNDGLQDLCVANWARKNNFYKNVTKDGEIKFIEVSETAGTGGDPSTKSNAVVFADFNNDGLLDLFITNRGASNRLYKNIGHFRFEDVTENTIGLKRMQSYGAEFGDFDNDGFLELYVANVGKNNMMENSSEGTFSDVTFSSGTEASNYSTGTSIGDLDNDGDLDLYCGSFTSGSSSLFINKTDNNNFITIQLEGTKTNRDAIGAEAWLYKAGHIKQKKYLLGYRQVLSGTGYCSHNTKEIHFGTGGNNSVDILITFPAKSKEKILLGIPSGSRLFISEETGFAKSFIFFKKSLTRFFIDTEIRSEMMKYLLAFIFIAFSIIRGKEKYKWNYRYIFLSHSIGLIIFSTLILLFIHREFFLSTILPLLFIIVYLVVVRLIFERVILEKRIKEDRENTRNKIARDLHDDLASTISGSKLYLEVLNQSVNTDTNSKRILSQISSQLSEAYENISDIVWAISPSHDSLKDLIARIRFHIRESCNANNISYRNISNIEEKDIEISDEIRRNIYYIFKEACHNALIHSKATEITLTTTFTEKVLKIQLEDNGKGIDDKTLQMHKSDATILGSLHGNGLKNITKRAAEISGVMDISSHPEIGTAISLTIKMT